MRIGIDVDGVLTNLDAYQLKYGRKYFGDSDDLNITAYDICDIFHCSKEEREKFWIKYIWKYCLTEPITEDAKSVIQKLKEDGHEIYILTGRAHTTENNSRGKLFRTMLEYWLEKNGITYDGIYYCSEDKSASEKYELCKELGIDVMIEDKKENISQIKSIADVICISRSYNGDVNDEKHIYVTNSLWDAYKKIQSLCSKNPFQHLSGEEISALTDSEKSSYFEKLRQYYSDLPFDKEQNAKLEGNYIKSLKVGMPLFNLLYDPLIVNRDKVPDGNGFIFVSNHLGSLDQFPIMSAIGDRPIHFLASDTLLPLRRGFIYKNTGAVFVNRDSDLSKERSKDKMAQYLLNDSNIFLFPEGTRNYIREKQIKELFDSIAFSDISFSEFMDMIQHQKPLISQTNLLQEMYSTGQITREEYIYALNDIDLFLSNNLPFDEYINSCMLPTKLGAVALSQRMQAPIVPFALNRNYSVGGDPLIVRVGDPIIVGEDEDVIQKNMQLRNSIVNMIGENIELSHSRQFIKSNKK